MVYYLVAYLVSMIDCGTPQYGCRQCLRNDLKGAAKSVLPIKIFWRFLSATA